MQRLHHQQRGDVFYFVHGIIVFKLVDADLPKSLEHGRSCCLGVTHTHTWCVCVPWALYDVFVSKTVSEWLARFV